jgi:YidC/Oxa1 family membrane protein insertase
MQEMAPKMNEIKAKFKDDKQAQQREMMKLQQEEGFNPLSGCLPMFLQIPVFIGLFHVLRHLSNSVTLCGKNSHASILSIYTFSKSETCNASQARIFNAPLAASFHDKSAVIRNLHGDVSSTRWVLIILLLVSASATLGTQLLVRANATSTPEGTAATVQRLMLWLIPVGTLASGLLFNFPLGVLLYWFTSNLWTLGQQGYIIRYHPPTDEPTKPVGELGKTLAPRPGQRPVRMAKDQLVGQDVASDSDIATTRSSVPRPGQRPNRPAAKRPPAKRPTQAKKRR